MLKIDGVTQSDKETGSKKRDTCIFFSIPYILETALRCFPRPAIKDHNVQAFVVRPRHK